MASDEERTEGPAEATDLSERMPPGWTSTGLPAELRTHPLLAGRYFYTLPLWDALEAELGTTAFDPVALRLERALSARNGDHSQTVGVWSDRPVVFAGLRPLPPMQITADEARALGWNMVEFVNSMRIYEERQGPIWRFRQGYLGWLLTNPQFLAEHDRLLDELRGAIERFGVAALGLFAARPGEDALYRSARSAFEEFLLRWRLSGLAGPYLPVPLLPMMGGAFLPTMAERLLRLPGLFYVPDTMPILSRDHLRGMLDDALHRSSMEDHLAEWAEIVRAQNPARNRMNRMGRWFEISHYLRVLKERHEGALAHNIGRLEQAMATFLGVGSGSIHSDLGEIRLRQEEQ